MMPVTVTIRSSRVADIIWVNRPMSRAARPVAAATTAQPLRPLGPVLRNRPSANDSSPQMRVKTLSDVEHGVRVTVRVERQVRKVP